METTEKKAANSRPDGGQALLVVIVLLVLLFPLGYSIACRVIGQDPGLAGPFLERPDARFDRCVKATEYMRFHHWELLKELRDETVRLRKRMDITVDDCRKCHSNREGFCNRCHDAVNLKPDCWGCHYYPETPEAETNHTHSASIDFPPRHDGEGPER